MIPLGLRRKDVRESVWRGDPSVDWEGTPESDRAAYQETGEARFLTLRSGSAPPTRITIRALTAEERAVVDSMAEPITIPLNGERARIDDLWAYRCLLAFAVGCDLPSLPVEMDGPDGHKHPRRINHGGILRLHPHLIDALVDVCGAELYLFYGSLVLRASKAARDDFLASSPESTALSSAVS